MIERRYFERKIRPDNENGRGRYHRKKGSYESRHPYRSE